MCAYLHLREALPCLARLQCEHVCVGGGCMCVKQRESERVLWDVSVFEQCVVVQPKALAQDFFSVWKWDYAFL